MINLIKCRTTNKPKSDPICKQEKTAIEGNKKGIDPYRRRGRDVGNQRWCLWERRDGGRWEEWSVAAAAAPPTMVHRGGFGHLSSAVSLTSPICRLRWGFRPRQHTHQQVHILDSRLMSHMNHTAPTQVLECCIYEWDKL